VLAACFFMVFICIVFKNFYHSLELILFSKSKIYSELDT
jgi:hypothetical protein